MYSVNNVITILLKFVVQKKTAESKSTKTEETPAVKKRLSVKVIINVKYNVFYMYIFKYIFLLKK